MTFSSIRSAFARDWTRISVAALILVLACAALLEVAELGWQLLPTPAAGREPRIARQAIDTGDERIDYRLIASAHLFGRPAVTSTTTRARHAPSTPLNLILRGVVLTEQPATARAIIAVPDQPERAYPLGAEVSGGATIEEFFADRIILKRNGRYETLRLNIDGLPPGEVELGPPDNAQADTGRVDLAGDPELTNALVEYRNQLVQDPASLSGLLRVDPASEDGVFLGYRIRDDSDLAALSRFGLRAGDLITEVNGIRLDRPEAGISLLRQLTIAKALEFNVLRQDNLVSFSFQIEN